MNPLLLLLLLGATPNAAPDVVVVCPAEFVAPLRPWVEHRFAQGHRLIRVPGEGSAEEIRAGIREVARRGRLRYVVLVGDAPSGGANQDAAAASTAVPAHFARAKINIRWGSEPEICTDNWYADLDDDHVPDVAVGRLTADSPDELRRMIDKTLAYERCTDFSQWRRRVHFVAGVGGFGKITDAILEMGTKRLITDLLPTAYASTMTQASWRSPYCPDPRAFSAHTIGRLNEGCLFWVYMGHGHVRTLDRVQVPGGDYRILDAVDVPRLRCASGSPIAFFMACYTGAFDAPQDCLAEELLRTPGAPVAVLSGSRVTMPYAMAVLASGLVDACLTRRCATLGEAVLGAKRQMVAPPRDGTPNRGTLDLLGSAFGASRDDLAAERIEHLQLFNLLGDPLLRLHHPGPVPLEVATTARAGQTLEIVGEAPIAGRCVVELVARRDCLTFSAASRKQFRRDRSALAEMDAVYEQANDPRWAARELVVEPGRFRTTLDVPQAAWGPSHVRVYLEGEEGFALGAADVQIERSTSGRTEGRKEPSNDANGRE